MKEFFIPYGNNKKEDINLHKTETYGIDGFHVSFSYKKYNEVLVSVKQEDAGIRVTITDEAIEELDPEVTQ